MLGAKSITFKKKKSDREKKKKIREKRREKEKKNTYIQILSTSRSHFICGPIELKFGGKVQNSSSYNLNGEDQILSLGTSVTTCE